MGWSCAGSLINHLDAHLAGSFKNRPTQEQLRAIKKEICKGCTKLCKLGSGGHPRCRSKDNNDEIGPAYKKKLKLKPEEELKLPSLEEIVRDRRRIVGFLPRCLHNLWGKVVRRTLDKLLEDLNDVRSWAHWFMMTKAVLSWPKEKGVAMIAVLKRRMQAWLEKKFLGLWFYSKEPLNLKKPKKKLPLSNNYNRIACQRMIESGNLGKALNRLMSSGMARDCEETTKALQKKHPYEEDVIKDDSSLEKLVKQLHVDSELVARCARSFDSTSAPGPSRLSPWLFKSGH